MPITLLVNDNAAVLSLDTTKAIQAFADGDAELIKVKQEDDPKAFLASQTLFGDPRVLWAAEPPQSLLTALTEALSEVSEDDLLLVTAKKITPTQRKAFEKAGAQVLVSTKKSIKDDAQRLLDGYPLPARVRGTILEVVGNDIERIPGIAETLMSLPEADLRFDNVVLAYIGRPGEVPVWSLSDHIDRADTVKAMETLHRISIAPVAVHGALMAHFQRLYTIQEAGLRSPQEAAEFLGVKGSTYPLQKAIRTLPRYGNSLEALMGILTKAGADLRGGSPLSDMLILEILVGRLCTYPRK